jgi:hypothetical protein
MAAREQAEAVKQSVKKRTIRNAQQRITMKCRTTKVTTEMSYFRPRVECYLSIMNHTFLYAVYIDTILGFRTQCFPTTKAYCSIYFKPKFTSTMKGLSSNKTRSK